MTTNVQFFDSFFSNKPSKCRKLHIVSVLLCTATQLALNYTEEFRSGLKDIGEIVQDLPALFDTLKRTDIDNIGSLTVSELSEKITDHNKHCIVNTRAQALDIYNALLEGDVIFHLSALMNPFHRSKKLDEIRGRLKNCLSCRVISTQ